MDNKTIRVGIACAIGAGIGTLLALHFSAFWWAGALIGSLIGYLAFEPMDVWRAIKAVFAADFKKIGLITLFVVGVILSVCTSIIGVFFIPVILQNYLFGTSIWEIRPFESNRSISGQIFEFSVLFFFFISFFFTFHKVARRLNEKEYEDSRKGTLQFLTHFSPLHILVLTPIELIFKSILFIPKLIRGIRNGMIMFGKSVAQVFRIIHSDLRLLCGIDSLLGALIGYFAGDVLIGMICGAAFGIVNYEIITKRVLHLPVRK